MRTLTATERGYVSNPTGHWCFAYLSVGNDAGTLLNLGALAVGVETLDFFNRATLSDSIDSNTLSMSATLKREVDLVSLSPFRTDSPANDSEVSPGNYAPLLDLHRQWRIYAAIMPRGTLPDISDYREMAAGIIDRLVVNGLDDTIEISGRGMEADILDAFVVTDRPYGPDDMESVIQEALDDQLGLDVVPLSTPSSPSFFVTDTIGDINLMPALADIAALTGWVVRYRYDASDVNRFTLFDPNRGAVTPDWSIAAQEYEDLSAEIDLSNVRNYIKVRYVDAVAGLTEAISPIAESGTVSVTGGAATFSASQAGVLADGAIIVIDDVGYTVSAFDGTTGCTLDAAPDVTGKSFYTSASITRYGLRTFVIDLSAGSQITDNVAAGNLADAVRSDLEDPALVQQFTAPGLWFVQLHDYVGTTANDVHYDEDQAGGVTSYSHAFENGMMLSTVGLAGSPKGRYTTWKRIGTGAGTRAAFVPVITQYSADYWERYTLGVLSSGGVADFGTVNAYVQSVAIEVGTDPTFALLDFIDYTNVTPSSNFTHEWEGASRAQIYYFRATPYSGPLSGGLPTGVAGAPVYAQTYIDALRPTQAAFDTLVTDVADLQTYVDAKVAGLSWKQAVRAATTAAGTLASSFENGDTIDGVVLATGDRILIKNQAAAAENGIYVVAASGAPTRATDADAGAELVNATCYVSEGTTNADTQWTCTTNAPITLGSTSLAFAQLASGGGGTLTVKDEGSTLTTAATSIDITGGGATATNVGGAVTIDVPSGGAGSNSDTSKLWPWDELPSSPTSQDDDFNGTSLDGKWSTIGGAGLTTTVKRGWLMLEATATGATFDVRGVEQVLPAGNFSVITIMRQLGVGQFSICGLHVRNATTGALLKVELFNGANAIGSVNIGSSRYSSLTNRTAVMNQAGISPSGMTYEIALRISYDGTNIITAASIDGLNWYTQTAEAIGTTFGAGVPNRVGLSVDPVSATLPGRAAYRSFRYVASANQGIGAFA